MSFLHLFLCAVCTIFIAGTEINTNSYHITSHSATYTLTSVKQESTRLLLYKAKQLVDWKTFSDSIASLTIVDIDNDGNEDIAVGIVKSSRWSEVKSLKMHLYKVQSDRILPLWRSSKLTSNLLDFCFVCNSGKNSACVLEQLSDTSYNLIRFRWKYFGLVFEDYILKNADSATTFQKFNELRSKK